MEPTAVNNLPNITALLNIIGNGSEVFGIACGAPALLFCWIPFAGGTRGYSLKLLACAALSLIFGLAAPGVINWSLVAGGVFAGIAVAFVTGLIVLSLCLAMGFSPTFIALREKRQARKSIILLNCLFFVVPFSFLIALVWASKSDPHILDDGLDINDHR